MTNKPDYGYASIQRLLEDAEKDWGSPEENRKLLLPYGIGPLDKALYGIDRINGEIIEILGPEKNRKTTLFVNVITNYMTNPKVVDKPFTVVDSLESGSPQPKVRDTFLSNLATRYLLKKGHRHLTFCDACGEAKCKQFGITPDFLRFSTRTKEQKEAIDWAWEEMYSSWPLHIFDANPRRGNTRNLNKAVSRWRELIEVYGAKVIVSDHLQQYSFGEMVSDYEKQIRTVSATADVVAEEGVVLFLLSQVSITSLRDLRAGVGKLSASGGNKAAAEANVVFSVQYDPGSGEMIIRIEDSRKAGRFGVIQPLEDQSGAFYGEASYIPADRKIKK